MNGIVIVAVVVMVVVMVIMRSSVGRRDHHSLGGRWSVVVGLTGIERSHAFVAPVIIIAF